MGNKPIRARWWPWLVFGLISVILITPLGVVYFWQSQGLEKLAAKQYLDRMNDQLNQWQDQIRGLEWSALTDVADDVLHLDHTDQRVLLTQTLNWRREGPPGPVYEGLALVDRQGRRSGAAVTAAHDKQGIVLEKKALAALKAEKPWAEKPWLEDYGFIIDALDKNRRPSFYVSGFIDAPGRRIVVLGAARRDGRGRLIGAVIAQLSVKEMINDLVRSAGSGRHLWLMDSSGNLGAATSNLARASARTFKMNALNKSGFDTWLSGSAGNLVQDLNGVSGRLLYRTIEDRIILGVVETQTTLGVWTHQVVRNMGVTAITGLIALAVCAAIFTIIALRRESRLTELSTLGRTAGTMSHNVGNALTAIRANLELISSGRIGDGGIIKEKLAPAMERSLEGIEHTLTELRTLGQGGQAPQLDGQAGSKTLYRLNSEDKPLESRQDYSHRRRRGRAPVNRHVAGD